MDVIVVGAGLAGLHCALRISEKYPTQKIMILDSYSKPGGRVDTIHHGSLQWEAGAGRIPRSHKMISSYCNRYKLSRFPISSESCYLDGTETKENLWNAISSSIQDLISSTSKSTLGRYTIYEVLCKLYSRTVVDELLSYFPYRSELTTLRADRAFPKEFSASESFYGIKEGLSAIIHGMVEELKKRGIEVQCDHRVTGVRLLGISPMHLRCVTPQGSKTLISKKVIFAVHSNALQKIRPFSSYPILKHLKMTPLLRTYAVFPKGAGSNGKVWFEDMPRIITRAPLRHIIPVNSAKGVIMASYTDADDTRFWHNKSKSQHDSTLLAELRKSFPEKTIPNPLYTKSYYWDDGCTYWTPGSYDPEKESVDIMRPFPVGLPDVYVCGESFSMKQAWMEGALEHAEAMLQKFFFR
jgi:monoamine oxidase